MEDKILYRGTGDVLLGSRPLKADIIVTEIYWPNQAPIREARAFVDLHGTTFNGTAVSEFHTTEELAEMALGDLTKNIGEIITALREFN